MQIQFDQQADVPEGVRQAVEELNSTGALSADSKAKLGKYPDFAKLIPDPASRVSLVARPSLVEAESAEEVTPYGFESGTFSNGPGCWITRIGARELSTFGNILFDYMVRIDYCADGAIVTSVQQKYCYLENPDPWVVNDRGYINGTPSDSGVGGARSDVFINSKIDLCALKVGCYATLYPRADMAVYGSGQADWSVSSR